MKNFLVLYMADNAAFENAMKNATPEQQKQAMDHWMMWIDANRKAIDEPGSPLGKTLRVDASGVKPVRNGLGGFSIVHAETPEAAAKMFGKDHPHLAMIPGGWIEITEIMPMG